MNAIDPEEWANVSAGHGLYLSHPWLTFSQRNPNFVRRFFLVYDRAGRLVGALPVYLSHGLGNQLYSPGHILADGDAQFGAGEDWLPALLCGTRSGYQNTLLLARSLTAADRMRVTTLLTEAAAQFAGEQGARCLAFLYCDAGTAQVLRTVFSDAGLTLLSSAGTYIDVVWRSFDEYLATLSRSRRSTVRQDVAKFESAGYEVEIAPFKDWYRTLTPLIENNLAKHGHLDIGRWEEVFEAQVGVLGDASTAVLCKRGRSVVACLYQTAWEGRLYSQHVGFDYDVTGAAAEYFNVHFYLPMRYAINRGIKQIDYGIEAYEPKVIRGGGLDPRWSVIVPLGDRAPVWRAAAEEWNNEQRDRFLTIGRRPLSPDWATPS